MLVPVIMAGGSGTRLWPLSRSLHPKQFLPLIADEKSETTMLQATLNRLNQLEVLTPVVICNEDHRFIVAEQLRSINKAGSIILEPQGRNTAPAIALAANLFSEKTSQQNTTDDPLLLILAADHVIQDEDAFTQAVQQAIPLAQRGKLVTFGIVPQLAHTGYGYIQRGDALKCETTNAYTVKEFVEKPNLKTAQNYLEGGAHYWNSGMFLFKASRYLEELQNHRPDIAQACEASLRNTSTDLDFVRINKEAFIKCPDESIDYAVMEKTQDAVVVPLDAGWNDIGSWAALWEESPKDNYGNATIGDTMLHDTRNCLVHSNERLVATVGLDGIVIVDTKDAVIVAHKDKVQDVKAIVAQLKAQNRNEWQIHREVYRPWGKYDAIDSGTRYQVKRITVKPSEKLSLQMHHHRAEHWIVVSGTAKVTLADKTKLVTENESIYIPIGMTHALENPGKLPLEMIEVQSGSYLGEDDIVRFEDRYGRAEASN
ncbi:MAG: mannose-1-phosphate guanylyltransferase/mannose-6-phosphate isomerase [Cycloclasticus sp.]|jgi:mannose-1-phosphate guanylyltransferase (GDP) (EC 2.7.7.22)/mannose-6-phosphate isomerase, type 2 (EC 5.3.1.8)